VRSYEVNPLSDVIGAEIVGLDLREELDDATFHEIERLWHQYVVLVFRDQQLETEEHLRFARGFGELEEVRTKKDDPNQRQYVMFVSNREVEGKKGVLPDGEMFFHYDQCYYERPAKATMLNALELPSRGGETLFANPHRAWKLLPERVKRRIAGLNTLNVYDYAAGATKRIGTYSDDAPRFVHPVVARHPETGREILYVNRLMTAHIEGIGRKESDAVLEYLFGVIEHDDNVYEHTWQDHDLVVWDNRASLHARRDFPADEPRVLRRITVKGERPVPASSGLFAPALSA
jgi:taurine dioxygenase